MKKLFFSLCASLLTVGAAMAASDVTVLSVTPEAGTTVTSKSQEFVVTFSAPAQIDEYYSGIAVFQTSSYYGDYYSVAPTLFSVNADSTVWTIKLDADNAYIGQYIKSSTDYIYLRFIATDKNGEDIVGDVDIDAGYDYTTWEAITKKGFSYDYPYIEEKEVHYLSAVTVQSVTPSTDTRISSADQKYVVTFSAGVELNTKKTGIYVASSWSGLSKAGSVVESNEDKTVWTISVDPEDDGIGNPDSLSLCFEGVDLNGDTLSVGAERIEHEQSYYTDAYVQYRYKYDYAFGTTYTIEFSPVSDDPAYDYVKLDEITEFTIVCPEGTTLNTACTDSILIRNADKYKNVMGLFAKDATADGSNFVFKLAEPIKDQGEYNIYVPDFFFTMPDGMGNREIVGYLYVKGVVYDYKPSSITPEAGYITNLTTVDLNFKDYTEFNPETASAVLYDANGEKASDISWGRGDSEGLKLTLSLDQSIEGKYGKYTLKIAQGSFGNSTWVDEGFGVDGEANPDLEYQFTLYDENNVQQVAYKDITALFPMAMNSSSYSMDYDTIQTVMEVYNDGSVTIKKFGGVAKYDLHFNYSNGNVLNADKEETEDYGWEVVNNWYCSTGRTDIPTLVFNNGWGGYQTPYTVDKYFLDYYGWEYGTKVGYFNYIVGYDAEGEKAYSYGYYEWIEFAGCEHEVGIKQIAVDGENTVRFYHIDGRPAKSTDKGLLIQVRNGESSRIFRM